MTIAPEKNDVFVFIRAEYDGSKPETFEYFEVTVGRHEDEEQRTFLTYGEACKYAFSHSVSMAESSTVHDLFYDYKDYRRANMAQIAAGNEIHNPWKGAAKYLKYNRNMSAPKGADWCK